jgi:hypothetical protein
MAVAVNILLDCSFTISFSSVDSGGGESFSGSISFQADKITIKDSVNSTDHSTAQDKVANYRQTKNDWEMTVETKFASATLLSSLKANAVAKIIATAPTGLAVTAIGLITEASPDYSAPSTLKFGLKAHATALVYT